MWQTMISCQSLLNEFTTFFFPQLTVYQIVVKNECKIGCDPKFLFSKNCTLVILHIE